MTSSRFLPSSWREGTIHVLDRLCDICLSCAVVGVPLMMAGIQEAGVLLFVVCSLLMAIGWSLQEVLRPTSRTRLCGAEVIIVLALGLVCLQLLRLPPGLLAMLSPFVGDYLTTWSIAEVPFFGDGPWERISLTPELTRSGLVRLIAYASFFLVLVHRLRTRSEIDRVLLLIAVAVAVMAMIGLGQLVFGNGKYLWLIEHPYRSATGAAKGTFTNQNHFAGFLSLGIGPLIWCWLSSPSRDAVGKTTDRQSPIDGRRQRLSSLSHFASGAAIATVMLAALLSLSRGGILAVAIALTITAVGFAAHLKRLSYVVVATLGFAVAGVLATGAGPLAAEWNSVTSSTSFTALTHGRLLLWKALLQATTYFWPAGSGLGSHGEVYPTWLSHQSDFRFSHAENGYLQVLVELGLPGFLLLIWGLFLCGHWCRHVWRRGGEKDRHRIAVIAAGLVASAVHSCVDFVWYIPGCMVLTLVLAACACRCFQLVATGNKAEATPSQYGTVLAWSILVLALPTAHLSAGILSRNIAAQSHHNSYRELAVRSAKASRDLSMKSVDANLEEMICHLESCLSENPHDSRAASDLSVLYLRRFEVSLQNSENRMTLREVQDTVRNAGFASPEDVRDWLRRAFGDFVADLDRAREMALLGLQGQPLRGETYIVLSEVAFISNAAPHERTALVDQAVRLRPHDPAVLYSAGLFAADFGDWDKALNLWREAYVYNADIRQELIKQLTPMMGASELVSRLHPGADGLCMMFHAYRERDREDEARLAARLFWRRLRQFALTPAAAKAEFWLQGSQMLAAIDERAAALHCLKEAVRREPGNLKARRELAFALLAAGDTADALKQLNWCRLRTPDDVEIGAALDNLKSKTASRRFAAHDDQRPL